MDRNKELYGRQIQIADAQIDRLVYDLYELTEEEIEITFQLFALLSTLIQSTTTTLTPAINADAISCIRNIFEFKTIP